MIDTDCTDVSDDGTEFYVWTAPAYSTEGSADAITYVSLEDVVAKPAAGYAPADYMTVTETSAKYDVAAISGITTRTPSSWKMTRRLSWASITRAG